MCVCVCIYVCVYRYMYTVYKAAELIALIFSKTCSKLILTIET